MEPDSLPTVFDLQEMAQKTTDIFELEKLRDLISIAEGTTDQKFVLRQFISAKIRDPKRKCFTQ